jgi:hypothetical protein
LVFPLQQPLSNSSLCIIYAPRAVIMALMHGAFRKQLEVILLMTGPGAMGSKKVGRATDVPPRTCRRWCTHFHLYGELPVTTRRDKKRLGLCRNARRLMTPAVIASLKTIVTRQR